MEHFAAGFRGQVRRPDQPGADASDPAAGQVAAAERRGNEDDAPNFFAMLEKELLFEILFYVRRKFNLFRGFAEGAHPKVVAAVRDQQAADAATHAVPDYDHRLARGETLFQRVEFIPQDRGRIGIGVAAGIAVKPELVILTDRGIATQLVDQRRPGRL